MGPVVLLALGWPGHAQGNGAQAAATPEQAAALPPDYFEVQRMMARVYEESGQYGRQALALEQMFKQKPQDYELAIGLARSYLHMGRLDRATEVLAQAKRINAKASIAYLEQGRVYAQLGAYAQAKQEVESGIAVDTASPRGFLLLGSYYEKLQHPQEAEANYRQALQRLEAKPLSDPAQLKEALLQLGLNLLLQKRLAEAEAVCRRGLEESGRDPHWRTGFLDALGDVLTAEGKSTEAEESYQRAAALCEIKSGCARQDWAEATVRLVTFYAIQGRKSEAKALAERLATAYEGVAINEDNVGWFVRLADLFFIVGDRAKAETFSRRILVARAGLPSDMLAAQAQKILARVRLAQGRRAEAVELFMKALAVFTSHGDKGSEADARPGLVRAYYEEAGKDPGAAAARRQALGLVDDAESLGRLGDLCRAAGNAAGLAEVEKKLAGLKADRPAALEVLAGLFRSEGKNAEALTALEEAWALKPEEAGVVSALGMAYHDQGQYEKAVPMLRKALNREPQIIQLAITLGKSYSGLGRWNLAQEAFDQAKRINRRNPQAYLGQGNAYWEAGDHARAEREFGTLIALDTASPLGYLSMGNLYFELQRPREAEADFRKALQNLEALPASAATVARATILVRIGASLQRQGQLVEAERFYRQALAACGPGPECPRPDWMDAAIALGDIYIAQGRKPEAEALVERLWKAYEGMPVNTESIGVVSRIAQMYLKLGDNSKAEDPLRRMLAARGLRPADPAMAKAEAVLAGLYEAQGQWGELEALFLKEIEFFMGRGDKGLAAGTLARLAAVYEEEGKGADAAVARRKAEALRAQGGKSGGPQ